MFKLIPSVVKGSWVIKQAVGNTPVLLGKKLTTRYYRFLTQHFCHFCPYLPCMEAASTAPVLLDTMCCLLQFNMLLVCFA